MVIGTTGLHGMLVTRVVGEGPGLEVGSATTHLLPTMVFNVRETALSREHVMIYLVQV